MITFFAFLAGVIVGAILVLNTEKDHEHNSYDRMTGDIQDIPPEFNEVFKENYHEFIMDDLKEGKVKKGNRNPPPIKPRPKGTPKGQGGKSTKRKNK